MYTKVKLVTPNMASELLKSNTGNRAVSDGLVNMLARQMKVGEWALNGEPIITSGSNGHVRILDGQHRLHAVVKSGISSEFLFVEGVDESNFDTIDTGRSRNAADVLSITGYSPSEARSMASAARLVMSFDSSTGRINNSRGQAPTNHEILTEVKNNSSLRAAVTRAMSYPSKGRIVPIGWMAFLVYKCREMDNDRADEYTDQVFSGANLSTQDIAYIARQRIERSMRNQVKYNVNQKAKVISRGWYYFLSGSHPLSEGNIFRGLENAFMVFTDTPCHGAFS